MIPGNVKVFYAVYDYAKKGDLRKALVLLESKKKLAEIFTQVFKLTLF